MGKILKNLLKSVRVYVFRRYASMSLFPSVGARSYETALNTLNGLQSNAVTLEKAKFISKAEKLIEMQQCLDRVGLKLEEIDKLNIIHVSGTKGKGSTCAFTESILRSYGFKTGFFSSPHIVEVRERIRINGKPLSRDIFSEYFWDCYLPLIVSKDNYGGLMPAYFRFLTIMAFHVFLQEKVDVAILEVGIGGQYDCTNVIRNPVVCGVSNLGMDHMSILGNTIEEIAWNKAGIFKRGAPAITVPQKEEAMDVLRKRALSIGTPLYLTHPIDASFCKLGIPGSMQIYNASLAIQLCSFWMENHLKSLEQRMGESIEIMTAAKELPLGCGNMKLSCEILEGLSNCRWPGRCQKVKQERITYYLDGAHTEESIDMCIEWFKKECPPMTKQSLKILWFNSTGDRHPETLLRSLAECDFDMAIFTPNTLNCDLKNIQDLFKRAMSPSSQIERCRINMNAWLELNVKKLRSNIPMQYIAINGSESQSTKMKSNEEHPTLTFNSVNDAIQWLKNNKCEIHILCTGSLHLVGAVLSCVNPNVC